MTFMRMIKQKKNAQNGMSQSLKYTIQVYHQKYIEIHIKILRVDAFMQ